MHNALLPITNELSDHELFILWRIISNNCNPKLFYKKYKVVKDLFDENGNLHPAIKQALKIIVDYRLH